MKNQGDVLFEFIRMGNSVKVTALDAKTGVEASIVGPATYSPEILKRNALRKLEYVLRKEREGR